MTKLTVEQLDGKMVCTVEHLPGAKPQLEVVSEAVIHNRTVQCLRQAISKSQWLMKSEEQAKGRAYIAVSRNPEHQEFLMALQQAINIRNLCGHTVWARLK
jgi:aerobic-type carbon monoxide dehydrogenase small subunit (CoxS/CutS family)